MVYLFLVLALLAAVCLEWVLDNILWIGGICIVILAISIFRAIPDYKEFGFDSGDFILLLLKLGGIAGIIGLICFVH
jgi:hypothetical protein